MKSILLSCDLKVDMFLLMNNLSGVTSTVLQLHRLDELQLWLDFIMHVNILSVNAKVHPEEVSANSLVKGLFRKLTFLFAKCQT